MRRALWGLALCAGVLPGLALAGPASLVVRVGRAFDTAPDSRPRSSAAIAAERERLAIALEELPHPPRVIRPLLGTVSMPVTGKAGVRAALRRALASPGPAPSHPFAVWFVLDFDSAPERDRAQATLLARHPELQIEPLRDLHIVAAAAPRGSADPVPEPPWNVRQVHAPEALAQVVPDSSILVAVIDTGADLQHPDLLRRLWRNLDLPGNASLTDDAVDQNDDGVVETWERDDDDDNGYVDDTHGFDFTDAPGAGGLGDGLERDADPSDDEGHGTHVAGLVAADGAVPGVAPFVQLMPVRAAYTTAFGGVLQTDDAAAAVVYAADNGARILNLSWGDREESVLIREAVAYAVQRGALVIAAAGNSASAALHWPSGEPGVLGVGSVDAADHRSSFSNHGPGVPLYAPGEHDAGPGGGILGLALGGGYTTLRGTSMSAPHVAGVAAIVMSRADRPDATRTRSLLVSTARRPEASPDDLGQGIVDALAAVQLAAVAVELQIDSPSRPLQAGRIGLHGTVAGGDLARWRADARRTDGSASRELVAWRTDRVVAGPLVDTGVEVLAGIADGACEVLITAESGAGMRREAHVPFRLDRLPPQADTLFAVAAWRGAEPRWLVSVAANEEVGIRVDSLPTEAAEAGMAQRVQLEGASPAVSPPQVHVVLRDAAGLESDTTLAALPSLAAWPHTGRLVRRDASAGFYPESIAGSGPSGIAVVWGSGLAGDSLTTAQAWGATADRLALVYDTGLAGRPAGYADVNGDGGADLLLQRRDGIIWLTTRNGAIFPDSVAAQSRAERALGFFQLDPDPALETLLSSRDSLYLYDDAVGRAPRLLQALVNPERRGFDVFGADAAVGDLDGDGQLEIACGDAEGFVAVFDRSAGTWASRPSLDTGGSYAYDLSGLDGAGFICGRQRTGSVTGDGFTTAVYEFLHYEPSLGGFQAVLTLPFLGAENDLRAGSVFATSPATGDAWLALVRGADLYLLRRPGAAPAAASPGLTFEPISHQTGAAGEAPACIDLDRDGRLDLVLRGAPGAIWSTLDEGSAGPHDLRCESLGLDRVRLSWRSGGADSVRVQRAAAAIWETIAATTDSVWVDTTLQPLTRYSYRVEARGASGSAGTSNVVLGRAQALPRLFGLDRLGDSSVRLQCTNPLPAAGLETLHWQVVSPPGGRVTGVALARGGREVQLLFASPIGCGNVAVRAVRLHDDQGGALQGADAQAGAVLPCDVAAFAVARSAVENGAVVIEFSRAVDPTTLAPERFELRWNDAPVPIATVRSLDPERIRLELQSGDAFVGLGIPYLLRISPAVRAAGDGASLALGETEFVLRVAGSGAAAVFPAPNPVRSGDAQVTFAGAGPDTRVDIFTLEGERVRSLAGAVGGGLVWDLRDTSGRSVASGAYIYIARDATGSRKGQVVLIR